ncbi:MAG: response regulator [Anaerolineae bacterium]|nr:response regulator [Anaerolineae bacterium]
MTEEIRILLVDDEKLVLRSMEKTLLRAGFDVETALDAGAGLDLFARARETGLPFALAILDLQMPDASGAENPDAGMELLSELLAVQPDLPVVVLSAFDDVSRAKEAVVRGARAYLVKGREAGLVEMVNEIVEKEYSNGRQRQAG